MEAFARMHGSDVRFVLAKIPAAVMDEKLKEPLSGLPVYFDERKRLYPTPTDEISVQFVERRYKYA